MNEPLWELKYLEPTSPAFLAFYAMYEKMVRDACRKTILNFPSEQKSGSYELAKIQAEMTQEQIRREYNAEWTNPPISD